MVVRYNLYSNSANLFQLQTPVAYPSKMQSFRLCFIASLLLVVPSTTINATLSAGGQSGSQRDGSSSAVGRKEVMLFGTNIAAMSSHPGTIDRQSPHSAGSSLPPSIAQIGISKTSHASHASSSRQPQPVPEVEADVPLVASQGETNASQASASGTKTTRMRGRPRLMSKQERARRHSQMNSTREIKYRNEARMCYGLPKDYMGPLVVMGSICSPPRPSSTFTGSQEDFERLSVYRRATYGKQDEVMKIRNAGGWSKAADDLSTRGYLALTGRRSLNSSDRDHLREAGTRRKKLLEP
jgi:hypothetical protein